MIWIGIDPGTKTGLAVWNDKHKKLTDLQTLSIHRAFEVVKKYQERADEEGVTLYVVFEDARQRTWYGDTRKQTTAKLQGAGSIKRDCSIWEDFLTDYGIRFQAVSPTKGTTKWSKEYFEKVTGWKGRTTDHARDAAVLVFGR